jgi:hypothetical protein
MLSKGSLLSHFVCEYSLRSYGYRSKGANNARLHNRASRLDVSTGKSLLKRMPLAGLSYGYDGTTNTLSQNP